MGFYCFVCGIPDHPVSWIHDDYQSADSESFQMPARDKRFMKAGCVLLADGTMSMSGVSDSEMHVFQVRVVRSDANKEQYPSDDGWRKDDNYFAFGVRLGPGEEHAVKEYNTRFYATMAHDEDKEIGLFMHLVCGKLLLGALQQRDDVTGRDLFLWLCDDNLTDYYPGNIVPIEHLYGGIEKFQGQWFALEKGYEWVTTNPDPVPGIRYVVPEEKMTERLGDNLKLSGPGLFARLPSDVVLLILDLLDYQDLLELERVNRATRKLLLSQEYVGFWKKRCRPWKTEIEEDIDADRSVEDVDWAKIYKHWYPSCPNARNRARIMEVVEYILDEAAQHDRKRRNRVASGRAHLRRSHRTYRARLWSLAFAEYEAVVRAQSFRYGGGRANSDAAGNRWNGSKRHNTPLLMVRETVGQSKYAEFTATQGFIFEYLGRQIILERERCMAVAERRRIKELDVYLARDQRR
ncbi:hypothetical protein BC832DRAFT_598459 [Gaertneriomyces semiglobifer]|nr:hypothetical protein BC832DRAFT_598459 [Gaertneriomyces semiglobifer]